MRIHHLNCGTMCPPFAKLITGRGGLLTRGRMVCHCLLVETNDGLALVDTGLGTRDIAEPARLGQAFLKLTGPALQASETALSQLQTLGWQASDVRHILLTHLDLDHAGGLADFPDAHVHIYDVEHAAGLARRSYLERERYRSVHWAHGPRWQKHAMGGERWFGFESVRALGGTQDELLLIPLLGHTRGHCGIAVRSGNAWLLHAGDAYYAHEEVHGERWRCPPGLALFQEAMQIDGHARLANQKRLRQLVREHGHELRVVCAHDATELAACSSNSL